MKPCIISLILWISLYSGDQSQLQSIHEEKSYFLKRNENADVDDLMRSNSWIGETPDRQHALGGHIKKTSNSTQNSLPTDKSAENVLDKYVLEKEQDIKIGEIKRVRRMAREIRTPRNANKACVDRTFGFYPDYMKSCRVFHLCLRNHQRTFMCPPGRVFDRKSLDCVEDTIENQVCMPRQMSCKDKQIHFYPDYRTGCKRFFMCLNGLTHYYHCPGKMIFSPKLLACVPENVFNCTDPYLAVEIGVIKIEPIVRTTTTPKPTTTERTTTPKPTTTESTTTPKPTTTDSTTTPKPTTTESANTITTTAKSTTTTELTTGHKDLIDDQTGLSNRNDQIDKETQVNVLGHERPVYGTITGVRRPTNTKTKGQTPVLVESRPGTTFHNVQNYDKGSSVYHGFIYTKPMREMTEEVESSSFKQIVNKKPVNNRVINSDGNTVFVYNKPDRERTERPKIDESITSTVEVPAETTKTTEKIISTTAVPEVSEEYGESGVGTTLEPELEDETVEVTSTEDIPSSTELKGISSQDISVNAGKLVLEVKATYRDPNDNKGEAEGESEETTTDVPTTAEPSLTTPMQVLVIVRGKPCNGSYYRPDIKSNCRKFYWCVRGQERLYTCPRDKKFSAEFKKCTNPEEVYCGEEDSRIRFPGRMRFPSYNRSNQKLGSHLRVIVPRSGFRLKTPSRWWPAYDFKANDNDKNSKLTLRRRV